MKILFIAREIPYPVNTGVRMRVWNVMKCLSESHELHLLCYGDRENDIPQEVKAVCRNVSFVDALQTVKGKALYWEMFKGLFSALPYGVSSRFSSDFKEEIKKIIFDSGIELIMCDSLYMALHVPFGKCKAVLNEHNIESVIIDRYARVETNILKKLYARYELMRMKAFEKKIWKKFDKCFVCSDIDKKEIEGRTGHKNVAVIPNGVDIDSFHPEKTQRKPFSLVYSGLISWKPNEDAVLYFVHEIYPLIKKEIPQVNFTIVGKGPSEEIKNLSLKDNSITITDFVDEVKPYILESEVFIVPLRIGSGTRLKILEAWAMGKAVVSTSIGCEGLEAIHGENILIADTANDFTRQVIRILNDCNLRFKLESSGRRIVEEKYSWNVIGQNIKQELNKL